MKKIITVGREYGSGGRTIARLVADKLGIQFYDNEIIDKAAEHSGLSPDFIKKTEQSLSSGLLYSLLLGSSYAAPGTAGISAGASVTNLPLADQVFNAQRKVIIDFAKKGPCVIVGRCSDYILRHCEEVEKQDILNVFVYAPLEFKVQRAIEEKGLDAKTAEREVRRIDKYRANHYNTFTERTWGKRDHYDILLNSSLLGLEKSADLIVEIVKNT